MLDWVTKPVCQKEVNGTNASADLKQQLEQFRVAVRYTNKRIVTPVDLILNADHIYIGCAGVLQLLRKWRNSAEDIFSN